MTFVVNFSLSKVALDSALEVEDVSQVPESDLVTSVELCNCPAGYYGYSCESCAVGYFR